MRRESQCILSKLVLAGSLLTLVSAVFAQTGTAKVSGVVTGEDKKPVVATITASRLGVPITPVRVTSASDGTFTITGLAAGKYQVCASVKGDAYLDPCVWSPLTPTVELTAGQSVTGFKLFMKKGTTLTVRVNDAQQALSTTAVAGKTAPHLIVGVFNDLHVFLPLGVSSKDAQGRTQTVAVPLDKSVPLHLFGKDLDVTDSKGAKVDLTGWTVPVTISTAAALNGSQAPVVFTVTPKKP